MEKGNIKNKKYKHLKIFVQRKSISPDGTRTRNLSLRKSSSYPFANQGVLRKRGFLIVFSLTRSITFIILVLTSFHQRLCYLGIRWKRVLHLKNKIYHQLLIKYSQKQHKLSWKISTWQEVWIYGPTILNIHLRVQLYSNIDFK